MPGNIIKINSFEKKIYFMIQLSKTINTYLQIFVLISLNSLKDKNQHLDDELKIFKINHNKIILQNKQKSRSDSVKLYLRTPASK